MTDASASSTPNHGCSSTASSSTPSPARRSTTSTRRPRRSSATSPTPRLTRCSARSRAARRAFDETDWSTNRAFRKRCLEQLQEALEAEREELREQLILEVGCPRMLTTGQQLDGPLEQRAAVPGQAHRRVPVGDRAPRRARARRASPNTRRDLEGAGRRRRRDRAVELPVRGDDQQARPGARDRQHGRAEAGARHAVERHAARPAHRRADRHPAGRRQRRHRRRTTSSARSSRCRPRST